MLGEIKNSRMIPLIEGEQTKGSDDTTSVKSKGELHLSPKEKVRVLVKDDIPPQESSLFQLIRLRYMMKLLILRELER